VILPSAAVEATMYRRDLAFIHHEGFGEFAREAAPGIVSILMAHGIAEGIIVDAGCGSGILARELGARGFQVLGFDPSPDMIALARQTAPDVRFEVAALDEAILPSCRAIVATGEVLNYGGFEAAAAFIEEASRALDRGGVLLFDVAECGAYPPHDEVRVGGDGWSVIAIKESDGTHLTRRVLTFRELGGEVARDEEVHRLELLDREALTGVLREHDFRVRIRHAYGSRALPTGHAVYVATRH
jgi:SAM-dependent methyltransferase